jgi:hypothetical protein
MVDTKGPYQNLTITPADSVAWRVRRSGYQMPEPPQAAVAAVGSAVPALAPELHTRLVGEPLLPPGGVTPPLPEKYGTLE